MDSEAKFQLQPSSSVEALELQAANLLTGESSGQRPSSQDSSGDQSSSTSLTVEQGSHQPAQSSQFEWTVLQTLAKFWGETGLAHSEGRGQRPLEFDA